MIAEKKSVVTPSHLVEIPGIAFVVVGLLQSVLNVVVPACFWHTKKNSFESFFAVVDLLLAKMQVPNDDTVLPLKVKYKHLVQTGRSNNLNGRTSKWQFELQQSARTTEITITGMKR